MFWCFNKSVVYDIVL